MAETSDNNGRIVLHKVEEVRKIKFLRSPSKYEKPKFLGFYIIISG